MTCSSISGLLRIKSANDRARKPDRIVALGIRKNFDRVRFHPNFSTKDLFGS
jgi:hypothetical protein